MTMGGGFDKLFDPVDVGPRWTRPEPPSPPVRTAGDALADLSAAVRALEVPDRARKALAILLDQIAAQVAALQLVPPQPAPPPAALAALLDRLEDHLEALVIYAPRSP